MSDITGNQRMDAYERATTADAVEDLTQALIAACVKVATVHGDDPNISVVLGAGFARAIELINKNTVPNFTKGLMITLLCGEICDL